MKRISIEIKAKCINLARIKKILLSKRAEHKGIDHQIDTYFCVNNGRLKLREGEVENNLIFYKRENIAGPKQSKINLFKTDANSPLKEILEKSLGVKVIVDKRRDIYFLENVKFHLDKVKHLGEFVEIEALSDGKKYSKSDLYKQCKYYLKLFGIAEDDFVSCSYSDLLLKKAEK